MTGKRFRNLANDRIGGRFLTLVGVGGYTGEGVSIRHRFHCAAIGQVDGVPMKACFPPPRVRRVRRRESVDEGAAYEGFVTTEIGGL
jgi:hypothetical protein